MEEDKEHLGRSTIYNTSLRLKPNVSAITKRPQGNGNPERGFCRANYRWATQLLLMYGELAQNEVPELFKVDGNYPDCFRVDKVRKLKLEQVGFFDESHKKQKVGKTKNGKNIQVRFRRDANGNLDPNGELAPKGYQVGMKFDKEARFCFGCALQIDKDGNVLKNDKDQPLGKTLPIFEYTESTVVTDTEWQKQFWSVVKVIWEPRKPWVEDTREPGVVYQGDSISKLPKMGTTITQMMKDCNVTTVQDFAKYFQNRPDQRRNIVKSIKGLGMEALLKAEAVAENAPPGPPPVKDHRAAKNPYLS
jgi:hypothetical protein